MNAKNFKTHLITLAFRWNMGGSMSRPCQLRLARRAGPTIWRGPTIYKMACKQCMLALVFAAVLGASPAWALPKIKVLATGGTIAGAQASQADAGYKSGTFSVDDLIKAVPQRCRIYSRH